MLVLGRLIGEEIIIIFPDGSRGRVVAIDTWQGSPPKRMKIGFDFPANIRIIRKELLPEDGSIDDIDDRHGGNDGAGK